MKPLRCTHALLLMSLALWSAAAGRPPVAAEDIAFELKSAGVFLGHPGPQRARPFCAVATDMDLDGDPDLLINWHLLAPLELFENIDGRYHLVNPPGQDRSGLSENFGLPDFYADTGRMLPRLAEATEAGVFVWHDLERDESWHVEVKRATAADAPTSLMFHLNSPVRDIVGLGADEFEKASAYDLAVHLSGPQILRHFSFGSELIAIQLRMESLPTPGRPALPFRVGRNQVSVGPGPVSLWKADPHGIAWVQVQGTPEPDIFITRGGLQGTLKPPHEPKTDRFYTYTGHADGRYRQARPGVLPAGYGRGRQVEWVDVDGDGVNELYIGCRKTPNSLLVYDSASASYRDRAEDWGLDIVEGDLFAWLDLEGDGFQDLVFMDRGQLMVASNSAGTAFVIVDGKELGLVLPDSQQEPDQLFDNREFHLLDYNNDGVLDLWISGHGAEGGNVLFRGQEGGFADVTSEVGLAGSRDAWIILPVDVDNDSYEDAVSIGILGARARLLWNRGGSRFERVAINRNWETSEILAATFADVDTDGLNDLILITPQRHVAFNRTRTGRGYVNVRLDAEGHEPIGALVRAHYSDGRIKVQRYGSANNVTYSQSLQPLHFGVPQGARLEFIGVVWPGETGERTYPVREDQESLVIAR